MSQISRITINELSSIVHLPRPIIEYDVQGVTFTVFRAKRAYADVWEDETLQRIVLRARESYFRYGDLPVVDAYDSNAAIYLTRTSEKLSHTTIREQWYSAKFVPFDVSGTHNEDMLQVLCDGMPLGEFMQHSIRDGVQLADKKLVSLSRVCKIPAYTYSEGNEDLAYTSQSNQKSEFPISLALMINAFLRDGRAFGWQFDFLSGLLHKQLMPRLRRIAHDKRTLDFGFTSVHALFNLEDTVSVTIDRRHFAYAYPLYYFDTTHVDDILRSLFRHGPLTEEAFQHYFVDVDGVDNLSVETHGPLVGKLLSENGVITHAQLTGNMLREIVDQEVEDAVELAFITLEDFEKQVASFFGDTAFDTTHPIVLDAQAAHADHVISYDEAGTAHFAYQGKRVAIPQEKQYDLTQATILGLNERLTMSATSPQLSDDQTLRDLFNAEWQAYSSAILAAEGAAFDYGMYVYYPHTQDLVRYASPFWHKVVSVASSSMLLSDPDQKLSWKEIRDIFDGSVIAVAGASVGNNVLHSVVMDVRPNVVKIADKSAYKMENINRVRAGYWDLTEANVHRTHPTQFLSKNKARVTASQLYAIDPFLKVHTYTNGVHPDNIARFLDGDEHEPAATIVIEEVDDPRTKLLIREEARKRGLPVIMVTDAGSAVQLDIRRFDQDPQLSLTYGISDAELYAKTEAVYAKPGDREAFFDFVDALIGTHYRADDLHRIINQKCEIPTSTIIPQLGSTAAMSGAVVGEVVARILLGHDYPERSLINKHTLQVTRSDTDEMEESTVQAEPLLSQYVGNEVE